MPPAANTAGKAQRLRHGRARAVDARKRDAQLPHRVVAGRTLGLQVARKRNIDFGTRNIRLAQTELHGLALQEAFGLLPVFAALLAKSRVLRHKVKGRRQRALALLFAACRGPRPPTVGGASNSRVSPLRVIGHPTFPSSQ